jgi:hypothetical protein
MKSSGFFVFRTLTNWDILRLGTFCIRDVLS